MNHRAPALWRSPVNTLQRGRGRRYFLERRLGREQYWAVNYFSALFVCCHADTGGLLSGLAVQGGEGEKQIEMKTHLPGIHNTSISSRESKDFQTLNNGTAEGSTVAAPADHLMLGAASKNSNSVSGRACLGLLLVDRYKLLSSIFSSKGGRSP